MTRHQKKALVETIIVMAILIALMFISGLKYLDPPPPGNIAINFGYTDAGSGNKQPAKPKIKPKPVAPQQEISKPTEKILTSKEKEAPVVKNLPVKTKKTKPDKPKKPRKPKPSKEASEALNDLLNAPEGNNDAQGEGNTDQKGDQGSSQGTRSGSGYYGQGGSGGSGDPNYRLGNRKALSKPKPSYSCNEEGKVVVRIVVDRDGNVVSASKSAGTTAPNCLTDAAILAAMQTKWEADPKAPSEQVGYITYYFKLRE